MPHNRVKALDRIEEKLRDISDNPLRRQILESAKSFKTSWIDLGRALYSVWKDRLYKEWGYNNFDTYTSKEIGIRKQTSMKLLRSYYFLEKEEPEYLKGQHAESSDTALLPGYEAIDVLRRAKNNKQLDSRDYQDIKEDIFQKGKDAVEARRELTSLIRQRQELEPEEAWEKKKVATVKRFVTVLKSLKEEIKSSKLLSASLVKETESLINKLEQQLR
jgi:hypothetical protein